jgi:Spy/CpxP family protein refolding chaperone
MNRVLIAVGALWCAFLQVSPAAAQGFGALGGRWWERPRVAAALGLSEEQKGKLEIAALASARTMIDLKAQVEKAELDLKVAADEPTLVVAKVRQAFQALQQARMRLDTDRFEMLLKVREVLTVEQWRKLQELKRERQRDGGMAQEKGSDQRPGMARPRRRP